MPPPSLECGALLRFVGVPIVDPRDAADRPAAVVDEARFGGYVTQLRELAEKHGLSTSIDVATVLRLPDVLRTQAVEEIDEGIAGRWPMLEDLEYHCTTLFPPVRPRGWLEVRWLDCLPAGIAEVASAAVTFTAVPWLSMIRLRSVKGGS